MTRRCVIVLGMHRSGTSALTGTLNLLGVELGSSLISASPEVNAKGFWEHAPIVAIHERLLQALGSSWHDECPLPEKWWEGTEMQEFRREIRDILHRDFSSNLLWGLKDPRMCRLLPLWLPILQDLSCEPLFILIARHPDEVAESLARRDGFHAEKSHLLWLQHFLDAECFSRGLPRVLITYEQLLSDWRSTMEIVGRALDLSIAFDNPAIQAKIDAFLEPSLRHCCLSSQQVAETDRLRHLALSTYRACCSQPNPDRLRAILEAVGDEAGDITRLVAPWAEQVLSLWQTRGDLAATKELLADREAMVSRLEGEITRIKSTFSWQITKPMRFAAFMLRHAGGFVGRLKTLREMAHATGRRNPMRMISRILATLTARVANKVLNQPPCLFPPGHFYSPIADLDDIRARQEKIWTCSRDMPGIDWNEDAQLELLQQLHPYVVDIQYPVECPADPKIYFYQNDQFPILDAEVLFCLLRHFKPRRMIEVGSGFSSLVTAQVNRDFLRNELNFSCVEPYPRQFLLEGVPGISELMVRKVEDVPLSYFDTLNEGDILFIDSSHVSKVGSDVNYLFFEIIPRLNKGVLVHIHDIFLPDEYPKTWVINEGRHWNEQYLVRTFLEFNNSFEILWGAYFMAKYHGAQMQDVFSRFPRLGGGGSLWLRRKE